ncbi:uncharacterized protein LOC131668945 isoform X1 [Phymastichus coffea]|uniref:uncharacterized protein LOC131668945 isoform X1 n=1 Tax=Phymastichus coffea TaxID=108790 RepID=UPI00273ABCD2|nr:uncharacterized protein LOC131668945 isoform X1 [Phymastichus coffea]
MATSKISSSPNELLFLKFDIDDLKGPNLPTNGDMLRYYFHCRRNQPTDTPRAIARMVVDKCIKIWSDNGIPTTQDSNGVKYLLKMLDKFNAMRYKYAGFNVIHRRQTMSIWEEKFALIFSIATKDAVNKCSAKSRKMLLAAKEQKKEFRKNTSNHKLMVDFQKQEKMRNIGSKSCKQPRAEDVDDNKSMKKSRSQQKRKQRVNRPGPKSSKKRRSHDTSVRKSTAASVVAILTNPDTLNNNEVVKLTPTLQPESTVIRKSSNHEIQSTDRVLYRGLDIDPEEEDIIPPMVQRTIIKEEIDMDWDQSDNWSTSVLFHDDSFMKDKENNDPSAQLLNFSHVAYQW